MPLEPGSSQAVISRNIKELYNHGSRPRSRAQIIAIAEDNARRHPHAGIGGHMAFGGLPSVAQEEPWFIRQEAYQENRAPHGFIGSSVPGRTDRLPMTPATDSYVVPADVVSGLGQGNSLAGAAALQKLLRMGPYGTPEDRTRRGSSLPRPPRPVSYAKGGKSHTPIVAAGGEFVIPPDRVAEYGYGDVRRGHRYLDKLVENVRKHVRKRLAELPPPKK